MTIRVGLIMFGDQDKSIQDLQRELSQSLLLMPHWNPTYAELKELVHQNSSMVDAWLVTDPLTHSVVREYAREKQVYCVTIDTESIILALADAIETLDPPGIGLTTDVTLDEGIWDGLMRLGVLPPGLRIQEYGGAPSFSDCIRFHEKNIQAKTADVCMTANPVVYETLQKRGIASLKLSPGKSSMRNWLRVVQADLLAKSQLAVQIIQVANFNKLLDNVHQSSYDLYRLYLKTQEVLLDYAQTLSGSYVSIGNGRFMIFTTRNLTEDHLQLSAVLLQQITTLTELSVNLGIGHGTTSLEAERNARLALNYAEKTGCTNCIYLIDESGTVTGPLLKEETLSFQYRTTDKNLVDKLKRAKVSVSTYNKIGSLSTTLGQKVLSSAIVSEKLGMSERNARKILSSLTAQGLAEIVGSEQPTNKGRPRHIYQIRPQAGR